MNARQKATALAVSLLMALGLGVTVAGPAQASTAVCSLSTNPVPQVQTVNKETGVQIAIAGANVICTEGSTLGQQIVYIYIAARLQGRSALGIWSTRDSASAARAIPTGDPVVNVITRANMSAPCNTKAYRKYRVYYTDVYAKMQDGTIFQITQGTYSTVQPYLYCGG